MMKYAQLTIGNSIAIEIPTDGPVEWDVNNFCTAAALVKDGLAEQFRVVSLTVTEPPVIDPLTQLVRRDGCELVDGQWQYKWSVENIPPAIIAVHEANAIARKVEQLWQAADKYTTSFISGVAIGILTIGVISQKPKALAVSAWSSSIWTEYYIRKAAITATSAVNLSFSSFGPIPYSIPELQAELGL